MSETRTRIKFCGITRPEDARLAADLGAWAVGMVFSRDSARFVNAATAREIVAAVPAEVVKVGVFQNQSLDVIRAVLANVPLDLVQLHGHETNELCEALGRERVVKTVILHEAFDVERVCDYAADYLLVSHPREGLPGQNAEVVPDLAAQLAKKFPRVILSGRLAPETVAREIREISPWAVDVTGSVEQRAGVKDEEKMKAFVAAVKAVDENGAENVP